MSEVTIRIWNGCVVRQVISISDNASSSIGAVGGAQNSTKVDIELDPWAGIIVDHRAQWPAPVSIREAVNINEDEPRERWEADDIPSDMVSVLVDWRGRTMSPPADVLAKLFLMYDQHRERHG